MATNLSFCWNGLVTSNPDATLAFFPEVLGWGVQSTTMSDGSDVTMLTDGDRPIAHVRGPQMDGEPTWWNNYLRVEDVDAAAASVAQNGGTIVVPGTDIAPGRFATVTTPSGAHFTLFREAGDEGNGGLHWVDLHSTAIAGDLAFLKAALGFTSNQMEMPAGPYHILNPGSDSPSGAMAQQNLGAPSMWLAWVKVDDVDATLGRVRGNGGKVLGEPWEAPGVGRMAIASDPAGLVFGVITPPAA
ncbi:MAG: putative enzyme related to lactoylglutathione lyase [Myxococcota bacterium]|jgi:predicted enzyme related to lactoylglutathione lyase